MNLLSKAVDVTVLSMEKDSKSSKSRQKHREYEHEFREKYSTAEVQSDFEATDVHLAQDMDGTTFDAKDAHHGLMSKVDVKPMEELSIIGYPRKVTVLYVLLSACEVHERKGKMVADSN